MVNTPINTTAATTASHQQALTILTSSGVLNKGITLEQLTAASQQIAGLPGINAADWAFVSPNYVYRGGNVADQAGQVINPA